MRKAIAIDFDGCLCTNAFPAIGEPNWAVINRAKAEQQAGTGLILWTCRESQLLQEAVEACRGWGLVFDALNESLPDWIEEFGTKPRKVGASEYWDDRAVQIPEHPNPPLTLDELREMEGGPSVWVSPVKENSKIPARYMLVSGYNPNKDIYIFTPHANIAQGYDGKSYGKTWLAYRRKPEEGRI